MKAIFDLAPPFAIRADKKNEKLLELRFALAKQTQMAGFLVL